MWSGWLQGSGSLELGDLSSYRALLLEFDTNSNRGICAVPCVDGTWKIGDAHGIPGNFGGKWAVNFLGVAVTISGDTLSFSDAKYSIYSTTGLGSALLFSAGDACGLAAVYGI